MMQRSPAEVEGAARALLGDLVRVDQAAEVLRAVAHPLRLRLIARLALGEACVNELAQELHASQPITSQQLRILRMSGLVEVVKERGFSRYRLIAPALRELLCCMHNCHCSRPTQDAPEPSSAFRPTDPQE